MKAFVIAIGVMFIIEAIGKLWFLVDKIPERTKGLIAAEILFCFLMAGWAAWLVLA